MTPKALSRFQKELLEGILESEKNGKRYTIMLPRKAGRATLLKRIRDLLTKENK